MARAASHRISADFIAAKTPSELRRLLLLLQETLGGEVKIITIQWDGSQWVAWFYNDLSSMLLAEAFKKTKR
jgi:hypothetical protein